MEFFRTVEKRRSRRSFSDKKVELLKIKKILKAASMAPSAVGLQSYKIYHIESPKKKERLIAASHDQEYVNTSLVLVFCVDPVKIKKMMGIRGERLFAVQDATIAATYAQLAATSLGLSSIWIGNFSEDQVKKIIQTKLRPIAIISIGYNNTKPEPKKSKKLTELIRKK